MLESDLAELLRDLVAAQDELLALLAHKQRLLVAADIAGLEALTDREQALLARLQEVHDRRARLLAEAAAQGQPSTSLRAVGTALPRDQRQGLSASFDAAARRSRLLEHHCLANWVLAQRTIVHLAQLLEIIATGGRTRPTYEMGQSAFSGGGLVDEAA